MLTEVLVALLVLVVGMLATVGVLRLAVYEARVAAHADAARWAVSALGDSLLARMAPQGGARDAPWGRLVWEPEGGGVLIRAIAGGGEDVGGRRLATLWVPTVEAP